MYKKKYTIAIDGRNLCNPLCGISRVILETIEALLELDVHIELMLPTKIHPEHTYLLGSEKIHLREDTFTTELGRVWWGRYVLPEHLREMEADVFWAPAHRLSSRVTDILPTVLTIHDLTWKFAPKTMKFYRLVGDKILTCMAIPCADRIIAVSALTARDLSIHFPEASQKIRTVHNIVSRRKNPVETVSELPDVCKNYCLFVGTLEPRKNILRLIDAFLSLPRTIRQDMVLVIVGSKGWKSKKIFEAIRQGGGSVVYLGKVDEDTLSTLYEDCAFLVMPSIYEGFGYPVIEAQQYGKIIVTSRGSAMEEISGGFSILVDPFDTVSIARGLNLAIKESAKFTPIQIQKHSEKFLPENVIQSLISTFLEAQTVWKHRKIHIN